MKWEVCAKEYETVEQVRQHSLVFHEAVWYVGIMVPVVGVRLHIQYQHEVINTHAWNASIIKALVES